MQNWVGGVETPDAALALPKLSLSRGVAEEIQNAIAAGKEVTVHEKAINAYGFSGFGYIIIDPDTGVGGYLIEGKGSGAFLSGMVLGIMVGTIIVLTLAQLGVPLIIGASAPFLAAFLAPLLVFATIYLTLVATLVWNEKDRACFLGGFLFGLGIPLALAGKSKVPISNTAKDLLIDVGLVLMALPQVGIPTGSPAYQCF